ncbi:hypothetical protein JRZ80_11200 [Acinetobacter nosocomialis]|uniref:hypothetical protein n=1 Tax=Acinetobacter nosocomialis TaxID=106654 RepID=UPI0019647114|nr:hypothetical protein [Acinetobacter nosocomialis]MBM9558434.1 hypothetical protein [Acinetobacter nosocomialis]
MVDLNKEREAFEAIPENIRLLRGAKFKDGKYVAVSLFDDSSKEGSAQLNYGWFMWQKAKAEGAPDTHVVIPRECPNPNFADSLFNYLRSKSYTEEKGFEYIYLSDIDETEIWNFVVHASEIGAEQ